MRLKKLFIAERGAIYYLFGTALSSQVRFSD